MCSVYFSYPGLPFYSLSDRSASERYMVTVGLEAPLLCLVGFSDADLTALAGPLVQFGVIAWRPVVVACASGKAREGVWGLTRRAFWRV